MTVKTKPLTKKQIALAEELRMAGLHITLGDPNKKGAARRRWARAFNAIRKAGECTAGAVVK